VGDFIFCFLTLNKFIMKREDRTPKRENSGKRERERDSPRAERWASVMTEQEER